MLAVLKLQMHLQAAVQAQTGVRAKSGKSTAVVQAQTSVRAKSGNSTAVVHDHAPSSVIGEVRQYFVLSLQAFCI